MHSNQEKRKLELCWESMKVTEHVTDQVGLFLAMWAVSDFDDDSKWVRRQLE
jgi:hypothetical protein